MASVPLSACGISLPLLFPTYWLTCTWAHTDTHTVTFCPGRGGPRTTLDGILSWEEQGKEWDNFPFRLGLLASSRGLCWGHGSPGDGQRDEVSGIRDGEDCELPQRAQWTPGRRIGWKRVSGYERGWRGSLVLGTLRTWQPPSSPHHQQHLSCSGTSLPSRRKVLGWGGGPRERVRER